MPKGTAPILKVTHSIHGAFESKARHKGFSVELNVDRGDRRAFVGAAYFYIP